MSDLIDRQAAIDDIWTVSPLAPLDREWIDRWLRQFPPANNSEIPNSSDTISRQAAIEALKNDMASLDHIIKGMSANDVRLDAYVSQRNQVNYDIYTINNLPPAQPEQLGANLAEVGMDCISRQAVLDALNNIEIPRNASWYQYYQQALTAVDKLPSIQPERIKAKWLPIGIADAVGGESAMWGDKIAYHVCEKCWKQALERDGEEVLSDFCPHCGAKMEVGK